MTTSSPPHPFQFLNRLPWEQTLIWALLILAIWILRDFFAVIFLTFILSYMAYNAMHAILYTLATRSPHLRPLTDKPWFQRTLITALFLLFVLALYQMAVHIVPAFLAQGDQLVNTVQQVNPKQKIAEIAISYFGQEKWDQITASPPYQATVGQMQELFSTNLGEIALFIAHVLKNIATFLVQFVLSVIFSFMILMDIAHLKTKLSELKNTRAKHFYNTIMPGLKDFGNILGRAFQAQIAIAICNVIFTYIGMKLLNIPLAELMSSFVFVCSFIPVLGVFISSVPICLVALQDSGVVLMLQAMGLITLIHLIEAYVLNPKIMGDFLKVHPLVVLVILFVGKHFFGVWGLLLGVPVCVYLFHALVLGTKTGKKIGKKPSPSP